MTMSNTENPPGTDPVRLWASAEEYVCLGELHEAARRTIAPEVWNFVDGGAGDEWTMGENERAFARWLFLPRMLSGIAGPDPSTSMLGFDLSMPLVVSPFGFDGLIHPDGHLATARAAAAAGTVFIVPMACTHSLEDVAAVAPDAPRLFQPVAMGEPEQFVALGRRAAAAGYRGLCVTVDTPRAGWRERSMIDRFNPSPAAVTGNFVDNMAGFAAVMDFTRRQWTWAELGDACREVGLPWLAKGILTAEDAAAALAVGAAGVMVSNHGGRQLDFAPAPLDQLPEIVEAVGGRGVVGIDGGVRRGSDVLKAVALGATFVGVGRPAAWGLGAGGEAGVARVLDLLRQELETTMALAGVETIAAVDRSLLRPADR
jgi:4-hydroxymandelate oxidase